MSFQLLLASTHVGIKQGMELRGVVHVSEVSKLVAHDKRYKLLGEENEVCRELNNSRRRAVPQFAQSSPYLKVTWCHR